MSTRLLAALLVPVLLVPGAGPASRGDWKAKPQAVDRPLPDPKAFGAEVRRRLLTDRELQAQYTFVERREEIKVSKLGKVSAGPVKTYEVYPSVERGNTYKRLIAVNGVPLPPAELARQDRIHREDVLREAAKRERETPQERQRRLRKEAKERAEWNRTLDEVFEVVRHPPRRPRDGRRARHRRRHARTEAGVPAADRRRQVDEEGPRAGLDQRGRLPGGQGDRPR